MKLESFLLRISKRHTPELVHSFILRRNNSEYVDASPQFIFMLNGSTSGIDFRCDFKDGLCKNYRIRLEVDKFEHINSEQCCCHGCAGLLGYLDKIVYSRLEEYAKLFDKRYGYWRSTGCILPRELRSATCLRHRCMDYDKNGHAIRFPIRDEIIFHFLHNVADAFYDYRDWYFCLPHVSRPWIWSSESFSKFLDEWVKRLGDNLVSQLEMGTWEKYYKKNPYVLESSPVKRSRRRT